MADLPDVSRPLRIVLILLLLLFALVCCFNGVDLCCSNRANNRLSKSRDLKVMELADTLVDWFIFIQVSVEPTGFMFADDPGYWLKWFILLLLVYGTVFFLLHFCCSYLMHNVVLYIFLEDVVQMALYAAIGYTQATADMVSTSSQLLWASLAVVQGVIFTGLKFWEVGRIFASPGSMV